MAMLNENDRLLRMAGRGMVPTTWIDQERDRRVDQPFEFNEHRFQNRQLDRENISGAVSLALAALAMGAQPGDLRWADPNSDFVWIDLDNNLIAMDAPTVVAFGKVAATWKSAHIFAARNLKNMNPIPADFADDKYWPKVQTNSVVIGV